MVALAAICDNGGAESAAKTPRTVLNLSILQKGLLIVLLSVVLQLICISALYWLNVELEHELTRQRHSAQIVHTAEETVRDLYFTGNAVRMGRDFKLSEASHAMDKVYPATKVRLKRLRELVGANEEEQKLVTQVERPLLEMGENIYRARDLARSGDFEQGRAVVLKASDDARVFIPRLADAMFILLNKEKQIEEASPLIQEDFRKKIQIGLVLTLSLNIGIAIFLTAIFNKGLAQRLKTLSDNVLRLASNQPLAAPLKGSDELAALDVAFRNMANALADARENEQALVENAREVICSLSSDLRFSSANQAIESLIGYERDQLLGTRFVSIIAPEDIEETLLYFEIARVQEQSKTLHNRVVCKNGSLRNFDWSVRYSADKQSYFCVAHDVTEVKQVERMKQEFMAMVSHDLRSPLASIQAFHECLERGIYGKLSDDGADSLHNVDDSISRLLNLVGDLLDVEQAETGVLSLNIDFVSVDELFKQSISSVEDLAKRKQINFSTIGSDTSLQADSARIVQVLVNLLSNAIKFSSERSSVELSAKKEDDIILFEVNDHGRGIPSDQLSVVFDRFKQIDAADAKNRQGSGLGLAISKAIVEQHLGEIGVRSVVGEGSTFWFKLPG